MKKIYFLLLGMLICCMVPGIYYSYAPIRIVETIGSCVAYPFIHFQHMIIDRIRVFLLQQYSINELHILLAQITQERDQLRATNIKLSASLQYLEDTQELREFKKRFELSGTIAQVLIRHFSDDGHYFLLDVGSNNGIMPDMIVIHNNCLVGKISDVYPWYSKVRLLTDRSCKIAAFCNSSNVSGIHEGCNQEGTTHLSFVSHLASIQKDELVFSSGDGMIFPRGFAIGRIISWERDGFFHKVSVQPLLNFKTLLYCTIIPKNLTPPLLYAQ